MMDEIFPNLSWMIYFPCEGDFARQCLCFTLKSNQRINALILMVRHGYLIKKFTHHSEITYHLKAISGNTSVISRRNV